VELRGALPDPFGVRVVADEPFFTGGMIGGRDIEEIDIVPGEVRPDK
jgi:hypothetical protein